jgi:hypothetical protein
MKIHDQHDTITDPGASAWTIGPPASAFSQATCTNVASEGVFDLETLALVLSEGLTSIRTSSDMSNAQKRAAVDAIERLCLTLADIVDVWDLVEPFLAECGISACCCRSQPTGGRRDDAEPLI